MGTSEQTFCFFVFSFFVCKGMLCVYMFAWVCWPEVESGRLYHCLPLFLRHVIHLGCLANKLKNTPVPSPIPRITDVCPTPRSFYFGSMDINSNPHPYKTSTSPAEPSSQPPLLLSNFWSLVSSRTPVSLKQATKTQLWIRSSSLGS